MKQHRLREQGAQNKETHNTQSSPAWLHKPEERTIDQKVSVPRLKSILSHSKKKSLFKTESKLPRTKIKSCWQSRIF